MRAILESPEFYLSTTNVRNYGLNSRSILLKLAHKRDINPRRIEKCSYKKTIHARMRAAIIAYSTRTGTSCSNQINDVYYSNLITSYRVMTIGAAIVILSVYETQLKYHNQKRESRLITNGGKYRSNTCHVSSGQITDHIQRPSCYLRLSSRDSHSEAGYRLLIRKWRNARMPSFNM